MIDDGGNVFDRGEGFCEEIENVSERSSPKNSELLRNGLNLEVHFSP
jgi:hypothetical protein